MSNYSVMMGNADKFVLNREIWGCHPPAVRLAFLFMSDLEHLSFGSHLSYLRNSSGEFSAVVFSGWESLTIPLIPKAC